MLTSMSTKSSDKKYSEIMEQFDSLNVSQFELDLGSGQLKYKLKGEDKVYSYTVPNVSLFANEVLGGEDAENYRKKYNTENPDDPLQYNLIPISDNSFWLNLIPTLLMLGVMIFFFVFMMKNAGGGKMSSFGKTNAKMAPSSKKATFDDVAGADEEKEELSEIVEFLRDPEKFKQLGVIIRSIPRSVREYLRAFCSSALRVQVKRFSQEPLQAKQKFHSSRSQVLTSLRCLWASVLQE